MSDYTRTAILTSTYLEVRPEAIIAWQPASKSVAISSDEYSLRLYFDDPVTVDRLIAALREVRAALTAAGDFPAVHAGAGGASADPAPAPSQPDSGPASGIA